MRYREVYIFLAILLTVNVASAYFWDGWITTSPKETPISHPASQFNPFVLNTPANIKMLDKEMDDYHTKAIKVKVLGLNSTYYLVKGQGVLAKYHTNDKEIVLEKNEAEKIVGMLRDGKIDFFERVQISIMLK